MNADINKIRKLQALAKSNNKHEATLAIEKARELLTKLYSTGNMTTDSVDFNSINIIT